MKLPEAGCRMPTRAYSMHMGAGALLSRGLLQGLDDSRFKRCVHSEYTSGACSFPSSTAAHSLCLAPVCGPCGVKVMHLHGLHGVLSSASISSNKASIMMAPAGLHLADCVCGAPSG